MNQPKFIQKECITHGLTDYVLEGRGTYRCRKCRSDSVTLHRKRLKQKLIDHLGGKCQSCGYDTFAGALEFHHTDDTKEFGIAHKGITRSFERAKTEAEKCALLCANCHREIHGGIKESPPPFHG